jgi:hypothetical protein
VQVIARPAIILHLSEVSHVLQALLDTTSPSLPSVTHTIFVGRGTTQWQGPRLAHLVRRRQFMGPQVVVPLAPTILGARVSSVRSVCNHRLQNWVSLTSFDRQNVPCISYLGTYTNTSAATSTTVCSSSFYTGAATCQSTFIPAVVSVAGGSATSGHFDGTGTNVYFSYIRAVGVDTTGNQYVGDYIGCTLRFVNTNGLYL